MKKLKPKVIKKWIVRGYQRRKAGYRCLIQCQECGKEREYTYSRIRKGGGIFCSRKCHSVYQGREKRGKNSPVWKGGKRKCKKTGYILIRQNGDYIREHRLVMEKHLGRKLKSWEIVHHKNGIKDDNRIENLEMLTLKTHKGIVRCPYCQEEFYIQ